MSSDKPIVVEISDPSNNAGKAIEGAFGAFKTAMYMLILPPLVMSIIITFLFFWYSASSPMVKSLASIPLFLICFYVFLRLWTMVLNRASPPKEVSRGN